MKEIRLKNNTAEELQLVDKVQVKIIIFGGMAWDRERFVNVSITAVS
jgi:hypothetical protein